MTQTAIAKIAQFFQAPSHGGTEKHALARTLSIALNTWALACLGFALNAVLFGRNFPDRLPQLLALVCASLGLMLILRYLLHNGRLTAVSIGLLATGWASFSTTLVVLGTVRGPIGAGYISLVVLAAIVHNRRGMWWMVLICALTYGALVMAQIAGLLPELVQTISLTVWITFTLVLIATAAFLGLALQIREDALVHIRQALRDRERADSAESSHRAKSEFLSRMSHELRTPLNGIMGFSEILEHEARDPAHREHARIIRDAGAHLLRVVNGILDLAKIEAGRMQLSIHEVSLARLIEEVAVPHRHAAADKGLAFEIAMNSSLPSGIQTDPMRFREVIDNLLDNAVKYTSSGTIRIDCLPRNNGIEIRIRDSGVGIDESKIPQLFSPLTSADGNAVERGLGLAIVKDLLELLGGHVNVESSSGVGSTFILWHPLVSPAKTPADPALARTDLQGNTRR